MILMVPGSKLIMDQEAITRTFSVKKLFLKILQNSQESICVGVSFLIKLQEVKLKLELLLNGYIKVISCKFLGIAKSTL